MTEERDRTRWEAALEEELAVSERENEIAHKEAEVSAVERSTAQLASRLRGEVEELQERTHRLLEDVSAEEIAPLLQVLPGLVPDPGQTERRSAVNARLAALKAREDALDRRIKTLSAIERGLELAEQQLENARTVVAETEERARRAREARERARHEPDRDWNEKLDELLVTDADIEESEEIFAKAADLVPPPLPSAGKDSEDSDEGTAAPVPPPLPGQKSPPLPSRTDDSGAMEADDAEVESEPAGTDTKGERRYGHRTQYSCEVDFLTDSNFFCGFSHNLSEGGLFVATFDYVYPGNTVELSFSLPELGEVKVKAEVRWIREYHPSYPDTWPGMGLKFIDLPPQAREVIERFMAQREPMFFA